jgi:predicted N-acetyltransferase YhbS
MTVVGEPQFYGRFGFEQARQIECEFKVPAEYFQVRELKPGALSNHKGVVTYHRAFYLEG